MSGVKLWLLLLIVAIVIAIAAMAPQSDNATRGTPFAGADFEASGVATVARTGSVLMVADNRPGELMWMEIAADGTQKGPVSAIPLSVEVPDAEGITTDGTWFYIVGSQQKDPDRTGLVRFRFDSAAQRVSDLQTVERLAAFLAGAVPELREADDLNIEGLAWDPKNRRLLLGLRWPLIDRHAILVPLKLKDESMGLSNENLIVDGGAIRLPLDGSGIRGIEHDAPSGAFRIIAGGSRGDDRDARLLEWNGHARGGVRQVASFDRGLKPEGVARVHDLTLIVCDTSRFLVLR